jgi:hypothetical protein
VHHPGYCQRAVTNAIGYPLKELPITPERVLQAIRQKQKINDDS